MVFYPKKPSDTFSYGKMTNYREIQIINPQLEESVDHHFEKWKKMFSIEFKIEELEMRKSIWTKSVKMVQEHNNNETKPYTLALNRFAAMTHEEFHNAYLMPQSGCSATKNGWLFDKSNDKSLPYEVDWRKKNVLSKVKNQGKCGSCWTFSTTGAIEAHLAIYRKQRLLLSEQQLVDCAGDFDTHGCQGGLPSHAFEYIKYNGGIETETEYPYKAKNMKCKFDKNVETLGLVKDSLNITSGDEESLAAALAHKGPVSIAFHVASDFRLYHKGVYTNSNCPDTAKDVNHAVLAVGYGTDENEIPYFIVKNSWGPQWGINGYFKIEKGKNMCGLSVCNSLPLV